MRHFNPARVWRVLVAAAALVVASAAPPAFAAVEVNINQGVVTPLPIAIPAFGGAGVDPRAAALGADIAQVVMADLERSGYFRPLDPASFIEQVPDVNVQPRFPDWRVINAQALVNGGATVDADGRLRVDFRIWDVFNEQQLLGLQFVSTSENWRRVAHKISDAVYKQLTGEDGYFDTRIVFVAESGSRIERVKRLAIMDQDGANPSYLTDGSYLVMTPRFSTSDQEITWPCAPTPRASICST
jgi:TolB protein